MSRGTRRLAALWKAVIVTSWRWLWSGRDRRWLQTLSALIGGLAVMGGVYAMARFVVFAVVGLIAPQATAGLLGASILGIMLFMVITAVGLSFSTMFFADDLTLLFATPLPVSWVLGVKMSVVVAGAAGVFAVFGWPVLWAYLGAAQAAWWVYVLSLVYGLALSTVAAGIGVLFNLAIARFIPPRLIRQLYAVVGVLAFVVFYATSQLLPDWFARHGAGQLPASNLSVVGQRFALFGWLVSPMLRAAAGSGWLLPFLTLLAATGLIFVFSAGLAREGLYKGWSAFTEAGRRARPRPVLLAPGEAQVTVTRGGTVAAPAAASVADRTAALGGGWAGAWLGPRRGVILGKDLKYLRRDVQEWLQLFMPVIVIVVLLARFIIDPSMRSDPRMVQLNMGFLAFLGIMAGGSMGLYAIPREGNAVWMLRTAPISGRDVLLAKFWAGYLPSAAMMLAFGLLIMVLTHTPVSLMAVTAVVMLLVAAGSNGIAVAVGAMYPRFGARALKQRLTGAGSLVYMVAQLVYAGLVTVTAGLALAVDFLPPEIWQGPASGGTLMALLRFSAAMGPGLRHLFGGLIVAVICVLAVILPLELAAARLDNLEV